MPDTRGEPDPSGQVPQAASADGADSAADQPDTMEQALREAAATQTTTTLSPARMIGPLDRVGRYQIVRLIAAGGMGVVYEAMQDRPRRTVALKVIRPGLTDDESLQRFRRESEILARLGHPCIAHVYEAGVHNADGADPRLAVHYFAMEYVPGARTITQYAREHNLGLMEKVALFARVCDALEHAHQHDVIHRDLKPSNILVSPPARAAQAGSPPPSRPHDGASPKVIDFGIARAVDPRGVSVHTATHGLIGTLEYMSPEQCEGRGGSIDRRSDVYALGVVLFELLTGEMPYPVRGADTVRIPGIILSARPTRASRHSRELSGDVDRVLEICLRKEPEQRYQTAGALRDDLERIAGGEPIHPDPSSTIRKVYFGLRKFVTHHTPTALFFSIAASAAIVLSLMLPVVFTPLRSRWSDLDEQWMQLVSGALGAPSLGEKLEAVRIIALTDQTDTEALAREAGLTDVVDSDRFSRRRLHGALLRKLGESGCTVVAFDMHFVEPSPFDADFAAAARWLSEHKSIDTVVGVDWGLDEGGQPGLSPEIASAVRWGAPTGWRISRYLWRVNMVARRNGDLPIPSLVLRTLASHWSPGAEAVLLPDEQKLEVQHIAARTDNTVARTRARAPSIVPLSTSYRDASDPDHSLGLTPDHLVGVVIAPIPADEFFTSATVDYADVMRAHADRLRQLFAGRAVLISNQRADVDRHWGSPGVWAHAAAMQAVLLDRIVRRPSDAQHELSVVVAGAAGALVGAALTRRVRAGLMVLLAGTALIVILNFLTYSMLRTLWNPIPHVAAMSLAALLAAVLMRMRPLAERPRRVSARPTAT